MPFSAYGVVRGTLTEHHRDPLDDFGRWYHVHLTLDVGGRTLQVAIDVDSKQSDIGVQWKTLRLSSRDLIQIPLPSPGFHSLASSPTSGALDYIRRRALSGTFLWRPPITLFSATPRSWRSMWLAGLPHWRVGNSLTATTALEGFLSIGANILVWGEPYPEGAPTHAVVQGVHNVHQNQGDPAGSQWWATGGIWQDGGVAVQRPDGRWQVFISRFSSQAGRTDSAGHPQQQKAATPAKGARTNREALVAALRQHAVPQLDLLEKEVLRQRDSVTQRLSTSATRAAVLVGAAGVLGGTQLLTVSGNPIWSLVALVLYLGAAILGLIAMRPIKSHEVFVSRLVERTAGSSALGVQRSVLASNVIAHESYVSALEDRSKRIGVGFIVLALAWSVAGAGVIYKLVTPEAPHATIIKIEGDVPVEVK